MDRVDLKSRMARGDVLGGTFVKTPAVEMVEILSMSGLDFIALDAEHSPFDRARLDACLAVARAREYPTLVRVPSGDQSELLKVLDGGASGVIVPHVDSAAKAENIARWCRFGHGGRGYAGSTRWAGFATRSMADVLAQSERETICIAQIEEPEGVDACDDIAATDGIDGLFLGPADLSVCYGTTDPQSPELLAAMRTVGEACARHGKTFMTFAPTTDTVDELMAQGVTMFFIASEHTYLLNGARQVAAALEGKRVKG